jgi:hypothetical protein
MPTNKPTGPRSESEQLLWNLIFVAEYGNCTKGRKQRDPIGCVNLATEVANEAVWASRQSQKADRS